MDAGPVRRDEHDPGRPPRSRSRTIGRVAVVVGLVAFGVFYLMLAMGAGSFVARCRSLVCGQLHQAVFAGVAGVAVFVAAHRVLSGGSSAAAIVLLGTVPILVVHVLLVVTDPNEAMFFPVSAAPLPAASGALLLYRRTGMGRRAA